MKDLKEYTSQQLMKMFGDGSEVQKKSLFEAVREIQGICNEKPDQLSRLAELQNNGYSVIFTWLKGNKLGKVVHMPKKKKWVVQVTLPELSGNFHKAWMVELPENNYDIKLIKQ
jgi:hypothetical protein